MSCYAPLKGWAKRGGGLTFNRNEAVDATRRLRIPCGQCIGCRIERSRQWAVRCVHEAAMHEENMFLTLTYRESCLPEDNSLKPEDMTNFFKRFRKRVGPMRYFYCGEYGEATSRPHYHCLMFGQKMPDMKKHKKVRDYYLYTSEELDDIWSFGHVFIGELTFQSAAYCARYVLKKRMGKDAEKSYDYVDADGVVHRRLHEFARMSRRPGLGAAWLERFGDDPYRTDKVILDGKEVRVPKYYDKWLEKEDPDKHREVKKKRVANASEHEANNTPERLRVREYIASEKACRLMLPQGKDYL